MATSDSQKKAARAWAARNKGRYKTISITQTSEQTEKDRQILKKHNTTVLKVWRAAMDELEKTENTNK